MFLKIQPHRNLPLFGSGGKQDCGGKSESDETTLEQPQTGAGVITASPTLSLSADRFEAGETSAGKAQRENERPKNENDGTQPANTLPGLPMDLLFKILDKVSLLHPQTYEKFENLHAVKATSRALRDGVATYPDYKILKDKVEQGHSLSDGLGHLLPEQREALINAALNFEYEEDQATAIAGLGNGLAHLTPEQHETLVNTTLSFQNRHIR